jgi:hypothetical protein
MKTVTWCEKRTRARLRQPPAGRRCADKFGDSSRPTLAAGFPGSAIDEAKGLWCGRGAVEIVSTAASLAQGIERSRAQAVTAALPC